MLKNPLNRMTAALLLIGGFLLSIPAGAQTIVEPEATGGWGLGIGIGSRRSPYAGADDETSVLPLITYDSARLRLSGSTLDWKLGKAGDFSFAARAHYDLRSGYEADDSPMLFGMDERKAGLWLGGQMRWSTSVATLSAELMKATGNSKGARFRLGIDRDFRAGNFIFTPRAEATWQDKKYVDYYYGVKASEVTATRSAYEGKSVVNFELGLRTSYVIDRNQSLFLDLSTISLDSGIKDSPLVDQKTLPAVGIGYLYRF